MCPPGAAFVDELQVPGVGFVDLACVGPEGEITLVECKLESNPEIHRKITGQICAYAAGLWKLSYEEFDGCFSVRAKGLSLADAVRQRLPELVKESWNAEAFRQSVAKNLKAGRFTLVIAVDQITAELKLVVPYINSHTIEDVRFLALEIGYVSDGDVELVLPSIYGEESANEKQRQRQGTRSVQEYFYKLEEYSKPIQDAVMSLVAFSEQHGGKLTGGSGADPSLNVLFHMGTVEKTVWSSYYYAGGPTFDLNFEYLRGAVSPEALRQSAQILRSVDGVAQRYDRLGEDFKARPSVTIDGTLTKPGVVAAVQQALAVLLDDRERSARD
jgi:hypothetical protein